MMVWLHVILLFFHFRETMSQEPGILHQVPLRKHGITGAQLQQHLVGITSTGLCYLLSAPSIGYERKHDILGLLLV